jgi:hypothetical protein
LVRGAFGPLPEDDQQEARGQLGDSSLRHHRLGKMDESLAPQLKFLNRVAPAKAVFVPAGRRGSEGRASVQVEMSARDHCDQVPAASAALPAKARALAQQH